MGARHSGVEEVVELFWRSFGAETEPESRAYADECVRGVAASRDEVDAYIVKASENWRLERMTRVDRNVLRLGTWELSKQLAVPRAVILDEAVELAKAFGNDASSAFVNGVLDRVADELGRRDAPRADG
jgi:N utilization substance protein B